jgi:mRNA interferase HigB
MHIVSHKAIRLFSASHPGAARALEHWYRVARRAAWASFADVSKTFNTADLVAPCVVFDIGGNRYRLIAEINFSRRILFIRHILTHEDYENGAWKS